MRRLMLGILAAAFLLFALIGCSDKNVIRHNYTFAGESESWTAVYKQKGKEIFTQKDGSLEYDKESQGELLLTYKNDVADLESIEDFDVSFTCIMGGASESIHYEGDEPRRAEKTYTLKTIGTLVRENEVVKVTVAIDGREETIELHR